MADQITSVTFKYDQLLNGIRTIKVNGRLHKVRIIVEQFDNLLLAKGYFIEIDSMSYEDKATISGECPVEIANELASYVEGGLMHMLDAFETEMEELDQ